MSIRAEPPLLVGRERELGALRYCLAAALAGRGSLVLVGGEAGIGKTALVEALAREAAARSALVLTGGCYDLTATPPFGPWAEIARAYRADGELPALPAALRSEEALQALGSLAALFEAVRAFLAAVAGHRPLVLVLEDLHWADLASLDLLRFLARHVAEHPLLLLATYRSDELTRRHPLYQLLPVLAREARATRLDLRRLSSAAVHTLVETRYQLPHTDQTRLVEHLQQHAEGNPLFIEEMLRTYQDDGLLVTPNGSWALGNLGPLHVPPFVRQVIDGRLARLPTGARDLFAVAAVIGQEVALELWSIVSGAGDEELAEVVELAQEAHVLDEPPGGTGLRFSHALIREALYEGIVLPRRRAMHRHVGEALAATPAPDPDAVAHHFQQAGDFRAAEWLARAGVRAQRAYAWLTAAERYQAAIALLEDRDGTTRERGRLLARTALVLRYHAPKQCIMYMEEASRLAAAVDDRVLQALALFYTGLFRCFVGDIRRGIAEMGPGTKALDSISASEIAAVYGYGAEVSSATSDIDFRGTLILWLSNAGRFAEALSMGAEIASAPIAPEPWLGAGSPVGDGYMGLALAQAALGLPDDARRSFAHARELYVAVEHHRLVEACGYCELSEYLLQYRTDDLEERRRVAAEAELAAERASSAQPNVNAHYASLPLLLLEGRWTDAQQPVSGNRQMLNQWRRWRSLGPLAYHTGDTDVAWAQVVEVLTDGPATEPGGYVYVAAIELQRLAANLALDASDLAVARAWIEAHDRWLAWSGAVPGRAEGRLLWSRYHRACGDLAAARAAASEALALASEPRRPLALLAAQRCVGELETADGHFDEAEQHLSASLALADACAAPFERALTLLALAELRTATGKHDEARSLLDEVRAICAPLDARPTLERAAALAARLPATATQPRFPAGLTAREVDVLRLVAEGLTDAEVGERLFLSTRTVSSHLTSIYNKLGVSSRVAAVRFASQHGLV
jgi:DNA-binding CsgD family transcriptional regulator